MKLVASEPDNHKVIEEIYYMILNRPPTEAEQATSISAQGDRGAGSAKDLAWALMNSPAFLFNR